MQKLHKSIISMLLGESVTNDHHATTVKKLNDVSGKTIHGDTPNFIHRAGANTDGPEGKTKHKSPVKDHYFHEHENMTYNVTVSHHKDNTASVQTAQYKRAGKNTVDKGDYNLDHNHSYDLHHTETHFKDLPSAISHVKNLHTSK